MTRERLANRRLAETFTFNHQHPDGSVAPMICTVGKYPDGRAAEVFFATDHNVGTQLDVSLKDSCILLSFALQHGCQADTIRAAMTRDAMGRPEGVMGTLLDLLATEPVAA
jgi:hypothetical protein